jgi:chromosome segregation ATPase
MLAQLKALPQEIKMVLAAVAVVAVVSLIFNINQSSSHSDAAATWEQEKAGLNQQLAGLQGDKEGLEGDKEGLEAKVAELEAANADLTKVHGSLAALESEASASKDKLAGLTSMIGQNESQLKVVGQRLAASQAGLISAVQKQQQAAQATESLRANQARLASLQDEVYSAERRLQQIGHRLATQQLALRKAMDRRKQILAEAEAYEIERGALARVSEDREGAELEMKQLGRRLATSQVSLTRTLKRQGQAEERLGELQTKNAWLTSVVAETETKERQLKEVGLRLATTQASLTRVLDQRTAVQDETRAMEAKLAAADRTLAPIQSALVSWGVKVQDLRDLLDQAQAELGAPLIN